jgi:hypothetical protein
MPTITILRRVYSAAAPPGVPTERSIEVTYATPAVPPRQVNLPTSNYRLATNDELHHNPRYALLPVDQASEEAERLAIQQDIEQAVKSAPTSFEVP